VPSPSSHCVIFVGGPIAEKVTTTKVENNTKKKSSGTEQFDCGGMKNEEKKKRRNKNVYKLTLLCAFQFILTEREKNIELNTIERRNFIFADMALPNVERHKDLCCGEKQLAEF
jgi:hypothetical protein